MDQPLNKLIIDLMQDKWSVIVETSPWFENETYHDDQRYVSLTESQQVLVDNYRKDGFVLFDDTQIDIETLNGAVTSMDALGSSSEYFVNNRLQDAWRDFYPVMKIATSPRILEILNILYQRAPIPFQTLNFRVGTQQAAHSDTIHFNTLPYGFMCGVWVALEETDTDNGPLFYYPGSQRLPVFHMQDLGLNPPHDRDADAEGVRENYQQYEQEIKKILYSSPYSVQEAHLKKGQALIWSSNIFHGGSKVNDPSRTRKSQVTHYYFPGCIYYTPFLSSPLENRWALRRIVDIRTRRVIPEYEGITQELTLLSLSKSILSKLTGKRVGS